MLCMMHDACTAHWLKSNWQPSHAAGICLASQSLTEPQNLQQAQSSSSIVGLRNMTVHSNAYNPAPCEAVRHFASSSWWRQDILR